MTPTPTTLDKAVWAACPRVKDISEDSVFMDGIPHPKRIEKQCIKCPHQNDDEYQSQNLCRSFAESVVKPVLELMEKKEI